MAILTAYCLLVGVLCGCLQATAETIIMPKEIINGSIEVDFTTKALGQLDFLKIHPGPNLTASDSWYFDAISPTSNESIIFNFHMQPPTADLTESTSIYHVSLLGTYANGTNFSIGLDGTDATIHVDDSDKSMLVKYFGGDEISWEGTSLLEPNPIYTVKVNSSRQNVYGTMTLRGRTAAPHVSCGIDAANLTELLLPGVAWANALPDADVTVHLKIGSDTEIHLKEAYGYHDKTWWDAAFDTSIQTAYWGHARLGPWTVVWFMARGQDAKEVSSEYLVKDGMIWAARCITENATSSTKGWGGEDFVYPMLPNTPHPKGMYFRWDLGSQGVFVANITGDGLTVLDRPYWAIYRGDMVGGIEGEETYISKDVLWTLNSLPQLY